MRWCVPVTEHSYGTTRDINVSILCTFVFVLLLLFLLFFLFFFHKYFSSNFLSFDWIIITYSLPCNHILVYKLVLHVEIEDVFSIIIRTFFHLNIMLHSINAKTRLYKQKRRREKREKKNSMNYTVFFVCVFILKYLCVNRFYLYVFLFVLKSPLVLRAVQLRTDFIWSVLVCNFTKILKQYTQLSLNV